MEMKNSFQPTYGFKRCKYLTIKYALTSLLFPASSKRFTFANSFHPLTIPRGRVLLPSVSFQA